MNHYIKIFLYIIFLILLFNLIIWIILRKKNIKVQKKNIKKNNKSNKNNIFHLNNQYNSPLNKFYNFLFYYNESEDEKD